MILLSASATQLGSEFVLPSRGGLKTTWQRVRPKSMASDLFPRQALGNGNEDALACEYAVGFDV